VRVICISANEFEENAYLVIRGDNVVIIDPGFNAEKIEYYLDNNGLKPHEILLTHGHIDHFGETDKLIDKYGPLNVYIGEMDVPLLTNKDLNCARTFKMNGILKNIKNVIPVENNEEIDGFTFHATPGHTQGSMVISISELLFTGDTLFAGSVGRTDLPTGSLSAMNRSLRFIVTSFSKATTIFPGHYSKTTLKNEIEKNQFIKQLKKE